MKRKSYLDEDVVVGLQNKDRNIEEWFYDSSKKYFLGKFNELFFDLDRKEEIFQDSLIKLWTQIEDKTITIKDKKIQRCQKNGEYKELTCSLTTFLMAIAKNEYREVVRSKEVSVPELFDGTEGLEPQLPEDASELIEMKARIVDRCLSEMAPRCMEILTLFYLQGKSLDDIMEIRGEKNVSKGGLKTAKYKCINSLKEKIKKEYDYYNIRY